MTNATQILPGSVVPLLRIRRGVIKPRATIYCSSGESPCVAKIDFCDVAAYGKVNQETLAGADKYLCVTRHFNSKGGWGAWYEEWSLVGWNTGTQNWNYKPWIAASQTCGGTRPPLLDKLTIFKPAHQPGCGKGECNPLIITVKDPCPEDSMTLVLAAYVKGDNPIGHLGLKVIDSGTTSPPLPAGPDVRLHDMTMTTTLPPIATDRNNPVQYIKVDDLQDVLELETGHKDDSAWLRWISFTTKTSGLATDCIACAAARPSLGTVPFPHNPHNDL
ncbi:hypothetical protein ABVT39_008011 [Epinephelus coioides]